MMDGVAIRQAELLPDACFQISENLQSSGAAQAVQTGTEVVPTMDSVVPFEHLKGPDGGKIRSLPLGTRFSISEPVQAGQHIAPIGEDLAEGQLILQEQQRVEVPHLGILAALNLTHVSCQPCPTVELLLTGDELLAANPHLSTSAGKPVIHDANGPMIRALLRRDQAELLDFQILGDQPAALSDRMKNSQADLLLVTGGTSVGPDDHATRCLSELGQLCFHGIDIRPGRPTAIGTIGSRTVILLPGNPVACFFGYELFVRPFLQQRQRQNSTWPYPQITVPLAAGVTSRTGRIDFLRLDLQEGQAHPITTGRASNLSTLALADGFSLIPASVAELHAGDTIGVFLLNGEGQATEA